MVQARNGHLLHVLDLVLRNLLPRGYRGILLSREVLLRYLLKCLQVVKFHFERRKHPSQVRSCSLCRTLHILILLVAVYRHIILRIQEGLFHRTAITARPECLQAPLVDDLVLWDDLILNFLHSLLVFLLSLQVALRFLHWWVGLGGHRFVRQWLLR